MLCVKLTIEIECYKKLYTRFVFKKFQIIRTLNYRDWVEQIDKYIPVLFFRNSDNFTIKYGWELSELSYDKTNAYFCHKTTGALTSTKAYFNKLVKFKRAWWFHEWTCVKME